MAEVQQAVGELSNSGAVVLSPADPRIVDSFGDFVFVASDHVRHLRVVQARHLSAIAASDFVWLVAPDGYVGVSAAMEIGFAAAHGVPVYSAEVPSDLTLRQWVVSVSGVGDAIGRTTRRSSVQPADGAILLDPESAISASHDDLQIAEWGLRGSPDVLHTEDARLALLRLQRRLLIP
jgi:hypothetical protein